MIDPNKHYSLKQLIEDAVFPTSSHTHGQYIRFIGTQATRGNMLARDRNEEKRRHGEYPFKGSDVLKFIQNIK